MTTGTGAITPPNLSPTGGAEGKKKKSLKRLIRRVHRTFSSSHHGEFSCSEDETRSHSDHSNCCPVEIDLDLAAKAVPMAEDRITQVLSQSPMLKRRNRLFDVPSFSQDDFEVGKLLAHGGFANVHRLEQWNCDCDLNEEENVGKQYIIKSLKVGRDFTADRLAAGAADMVVEAYVMTALDHPNIIKLRGMSNKGLASLKRGRMDGLFLMLDYLPLTLYRQFNRWRKESQSATSIPDRMDSALQLAKALEYVHSKNIIYRDLKPGNAGYTKDGVLQLFDFGLAVEIPFTKDPDQLFDLAGKKGTPRYMAPEVGKRKQYNAKADVFSFSMILWQLLALEKPFSNQTSSDAALERILHGDRPSLKKIQELPLPAEDVEILQQLLQNGWSKKITERPTMEQFRKQLEDIIPEEGVLLSSSDRSASGDDASHQ